MSDCIFCKIANKEIPSNIVYENDLVMAILDVSPVSLGHVLIIPKKHAENIYDIKEEYLKEIILTAKKIALGYKKIFNINDVQLIHNAGKNAQQEVFHFHLHLIPRAEGDGINLSIPKNDSLKEKFAEFMDRINNSGIV